MRLLASILLLLAASSEAATTYWVTQAGAGSGNGTSLENAWSLASFHSSGVPTGGDTVNFRGTFTGTVTAKSGTGDGASRLTMDFGGATVPSVDIGGEAYLTLVGGVIAGTTTGSLFPFSSTIHDITITNWTYGTDTIDRAAQVLVSAAAVNYNVVIDSCSFSNASMLVNLYGSPSHDITVRNTFFWQSLDISAQNDIIKLAGGYNVLVEGCKIVSRAPPDQSDPPGDPRHNDIFQTWSGGQDWVIRYNWIELCPPSGNEAGDSSFMMMEGMDGAIKIYGNVFIGGTRSGIQCANGIDFNGNASGCTVYFYNNTVITKNGPRLTLRFESPGSAYVRNNIGTDSTSPLMDNFIYNWSMTEAADWNYNWFYNCGGATATHTGANGGTTDPVFSDYANNVFTLQSSSPCKASGNDLGSEYNQGIDEDATWPNPTLATRTSWDVGAYVYGTAGGGGTAPSITAQPQNASKTVGQDATFTVTATGTATLTYQWRLDGSAINGATTSSYTKSNVQLADDGTLYTVGVTNDYGGVLSDAATLTVSAAPNPPDVPPGQVRVNTLNVGTIRMAQ